MKPLSDLARIEQVQALEMVMGALRLAFYPPVTRIIQNNLRIIAQVLPLDLQTRREELVVLDAFAFDALFRETMNPLRTDAMPAELRLSASIIAIVAAAARSMSGPMGGPIAAYGRARVDDREPDPEHLQHFRKEGLAGHEAVFLARYFNNLLEFMGEPERTDLEATVLGPRSAAGRRQQWTADESARLRAGGYEESPEERIQRRRGAPARPESLDIPSFLRRPPSRGNDGADS